MPLVNKLREASLFKVYKSTTLACGCRIQFQIGRDHWDNSSSIIYHDINLPEDHKKLVSELLDIWKQISLHG